jgi:O-acetyl-ADP-ribose deacetylase (regulator of RNase III)
VTTIAIIPTGRIKQHFPQQQEEEQQELHPHLLKRIEEVTTVVVEEGDQKIEKTAYISSPHMETSLNIIHCCKCKR